MFSTTTQGSKNWFDNPIKLNGIPRGWEHAHELFEGLKRLTEVEADIHLVDVFEISRERRKMVGIVPLPRGCLT